MQASGLSYPQFAITTTYSQAGVYPAAVRLRDQYGVVVYQARQVVEVVTAAMVDGFARGVWNKMNDALVAANVIKAQAFLTESAKKNYVDAFNELSTDFSTIVASYYALATMEDALTQVRLSVHRTIGGVDYVFPLHFVLGQDGVWRLASM